MSAARRGPPPLVGALCALVLGALGVEASARENLDTERALSKVLMTPTEKAGLEGKGPTDEYYTPGDDDDSWAILPQIGFSPDKGLNGGIKYTDRNLGAAGLTLDLGALYAAQGQQKLDLTVVAPGLFSDWLIAAFQAHFLSDPSREFFGLGNNDTGPDELSTHRYQTTTALATLAVRPFERLTLAATAGFADVHIGRGDTPDDVPSTVAAFPSLAGIDGGRTNPVAVSLVFNNREDLTRPSRGWRFIAKAQRVDRALDNDFEFTRYTLDASYLLPLLSRRQVLGIRVAGEHIDGNTRDIPFYELASLGGDDDLRGFFEDRFLGRSRVMANLEYRLKLLDFDFFDLTRVRIDGVAFGDAGRVFIDDDELEEQFNVEDDILEEIADEFRYSYGGGTRIALGRALVARIDVGFSEEESGLVYLTFGQTF